MTVSIQSYSEIQFNIALLLSWQTFQDTDKKKKELKQQRLQRDIPTFVQLQTYQALHFSEYYWILSFFRFLHHCPKMPMSFKLCASSLYHKMIIFYL